MIGNHLLRFKKDQIYLAKDWETESLNLCYSRPWQLSYIVFNLNEILEKKTSYIWYEDLKVSKDAARITRFNYDEYKKNAISPDLILADLDKYIYDSNIITMSHNLFHFDAEIHQVARKSIGLKSDYSYLGRAIDTWALSKFYNDAIKPDLQNFTESQYKILSKKSKRGSGTISTMAKTFDIQIDESKIHDAGYDTIILMHIFKKLIFCVEI